MKNPTLQQYNYHQWANSRVLNHLKELPKEIYSNEVKSVFSSIEEVIAIEHPKYGKLDTPISGMIKHIVNHGTYHRGNITAMLHQQGESGVPTDYVFYLYGSSAQPPLSS